MKSKRKLLEDSRLYAIIDRGTLGNRSIRSLAKGIKGSGIDIIQLRDKVSDRHHILAEARLLKGLLRNTQTLFIINDYLDMAKMVDTDGIHLGQDDVPVEIARRLLGRDKIIGISCHSLGQAQEAQRQGADYISIGPVFPTPTKPEYKATGLKLIKAVKKNIKIPFFAIGGINQENIERVMSYGAERIAVCRPVCVSWDIASTARNLSRILR